MATASDYNVTFGYGIKADLNGDGIKEYTHRGIDYPTPSGTPVIIEGVKIGLTGASGYTFGAHLHVQAGTDFWAQKTINPTPYAFKPGTVVQTGWGDQWGNYVIIQVGKIYVVYAHLSKIDAKKGQTVQSNEADMKTSRGEAIRLLRIARYPRSEENIKSWTGRNLDELLSKIERSKWWKAHSEVINDYAQLKTENAEFEKEIIKLREVVDGLDKQVKDLTLKVKEYQATKPKPLVEYSFKELIDVLIKKIKLRR